MKTDSSLPHTKQAVKVIRIVIKAMPWIIFLIYFFSFLGFFWVQINLGLHTPEYTPRSYNLQPFKTILGYLLNQDHINQSMIISNLAGNITALVPLGFLLPMLFKLRKYRWFILTCSIIISLFELTQFVTKAGSLDIDDLILNLIGCSIGFILYVIIAKLYFISIKRLLYLKRESKSKHS